MHPLVTIETGYRAGIIGRITEMHARYYVRPEGFGRTFEAIVAEGLAHFCNRLDNPVNQIWTATVNDEVLGSIAIDGEDLAPGIAHLRWFIVDEQLRGSGTGRRLLTAALKFIDDTKYNETHLWTFKGLDAALHLYESCGFSLVEERLGKQWGAEVMEQRMVRYTGRPVSHKR
jgi:GNAT superfamily N-acetyltransferase